MYKLLPYSTFVYFNMLWFITIKTSFYFKKKSWLFEASSERNSESSELKDKIITSEEIS